MKKFFLLLAFLLAIPLVSASSIQQFNSIHLTPYYYNSLPANMNQTFWIKINPPDNIGKVLSALFHFKTFTSGSSTNYTLYVNGTFCNYFYVSTTYANAGQNEIAFDCTKLITKAGNYTINLSSNRDTGSGFGWLDLTYMNNPPEISIHGTEYQTGDNATIWLQLLDSGMNPINNAMCLLDLYYPNKQVWLSNATMNLLNNSAGVYYFDTIPTQTGVYMTTVKCNYIVQQTRDYADAFTLNQGSVVSGDYTDTWSKDSVFHSIKESRVSGTYVMDYDYVFHTENIPSNYTGMIIEWTGKWTDSISPTKLYLYNWCNATWSGALPNQITTNTPMVSNFLPSDKWNVSCYIRTQFGSNDLMIKFNSSDTISGYQIDNDFLEVRMEYTEFGQINEIKGSGEMHVSEYPTSSFVSTTEYSQNETGIFIMQFFISEAGRMNPVNDGSCYGTLYYPNGSVFVNNTQFHYKDGTNGLYMFNTTIPDIDGVYFIDGNCVKKGIRAYSSSTFHVNPSFKKIEEIGNSTINTTELIVTGTEYTSNETGLVLAQFLRTVAGNPQPINDGNCNITANFPNTSYFIYESPMTYLSGSNGLYYKAFTAPETGVYPIDVICWKGGISSYSSSTFHVSNSTNSLISAANSSIFGKLVKIQDEITSVNNTVKTESSNINSNLQGNFTNTNNLIIGVNNTVNWWGNVTNTTIDLWGNTLYGRIDYWGNTLETKLDNLILGNITLTVDVDYDKIALYTLSYLRAMEKIKII